MDPLSKTAGGPNHPDESDLLERLDVAKYGLAPA
jgi:hypothetical protein